MEPGVGLPGEVRLRFGQYEFGESSGRLWRNGLPVRLQSQPARVLAMLLAADGEVVSREALQKTLWPDDSFGDFDTGLNTAIKKLRQALADSPQNPRFVETLPRLGYRFLAPVVRVLPATHPVPEMPPPAPQLEANSTAVPSEEAATLSPAASLPPALPAQTPSPRQPSSRRFPWVAAVLVLLALLAGAAVGPRWLARDSGGTPDAIRLQLALPPDQSIPADYRGRLLGIVADGSEVFFVAAESGTRYVFRRRLNSTTADRVPGTEGATSLAVSPDASQLLFYRSGEIWLVDLTSQTSRMIASPNDAWNPTHNFLIAADGTIFLTVAPRFKAGSGSGPLSQSPPRAANEIYSSKDGKEWRWEGPASDASGLRGEEFQFPQQLLPDGQLLFSSVWSPRDRSIYLRNRESGETRLLSEAAMGGHLTEDGTLVAFWDGSAWAQPLRPGSNPPPRVTLANRVIAAGWSAGHMDVARNGTLVYLEAPQPASLELVWVDPSGKQTPVPAPARPYSLLDLSPDGDRVLVGLSESATIRSIWSYSLRTGEWVRLAEDAPEPCTGIWSPGGGHALLTSYFGDLRFPNLAAAEAGGKSAFLRLSPSESAQFPTSWPGGGAPIAFVRSEVKGTQTDIGLLFPQSGGNRKDTEVREPAPGMEWKLQMLSQPGDQRHPAISPDGKLLAFAHGILDDASVRVCALPDCATVITVPESAGGVAPLWDENGQALFFRRNQSVYVARLRPLNQGAPVFSPAVKLFDGDFSLANFWNREMVYDPRGRRFLLTRFRKAAEPVRQIHVVLNWPSLLQQASAPPQ